MAAALGTPLILDRWPHHDKQRADDNIFLSTDWKTLKIAVVVAEFETWAKTTSITDDMSDVMLFVDALE